MIDTMIIPGPAAMAIRTDRTAAGAAGGVGYKRQVRCTRMTGGTIVMLLVVATVGEERIINGLGMTIQTRCLGVHTVGRIMINVMGEQV